MEGWIKIFSHKIRLDEIKIIIIIIHIVHVVKKRIGIQLIF